MLALGDTGANGMSLKALAETTGDSRPALLRALTTLASRGFIEPTGRRGCYRLGPAIFGLAHRPGPVDAKLEALRPALYELVGDTGYSVFLMAEAGLDAVCLELVTSTPIRSLTGGTGGRVPLGIAAGSLAILSALPEESSSAVIEANAMRYASYPAVIPMSAGRVQQMVDETRINGYSCDFGCFFPNEGGIGVAVPAIHGGSSGLSVAISVHGEIAGRESLARLARQVQDVLRRRQIAI